MEETDLRDQFASVALLGVMVSRAILAAVHVVRPEATDDASVAKQAYVVADAMLMARRRRK